MALIDIYKNLIIFDNFGNPIPKIEDGGVFVSNINLKKHSVHIPEHSTIYLMEKYIDIDNGGMINVKHVNSDNSINFKINGNGFYLYHLNEDNTISKNSGYSLERNVLTKILNESGYDESGLIDKTPIIINLLHIGEEEEIHDGLFEIYIGDILIWKIILYTETEDEDERFVELLSNIGEDVTNRHELIFKNSDINEDLPNAMLLNEKRKEFLTVINDITPYIASVRGILQIIDFFDYKNVVEVKEYWYNPEDDKIRIIPITEAYKDTSNIKLQKFGLFYKINYPTEDVDDNGLPILKDNFLISHEEVLIKLHALKNYFIEKDYGGISDIVDIIGEVYNYQLLTIKHWKTTTDVLIYDHIPVADFKVENIDHYIVPILEPQENFIAPYQNISDLSSYKLYEIGKHSFTHFKGFLNGDIKINDDGNVRVGSRVKIFNNTFNNKMSNMNYCWDSGSLLDVYWYNAYAPNYYSVQYIISRNVESTTEDGRTFNIVYSGKLSDMDEIEVIVPYNGWYDVTISVIGYDGITTSSYVKKAFEVKLKDTNFMFLFKIIDKNLQTFASNDLTWNSINQEFNETINYNDNLKSSDDTVSPIYSYMDKWDIGGGILKPIFKNNNFTWKDYSMISWEDTYYESLELQRFVYSGIIQKSTLQINDVELEIPDINVLEYQLLEALFEKTFRTDYQYTHRKRLNHDVIEGVYMGYGNDGDTYIGSSENNLFDKNKMETWSDIEKPFHEIPLSFKNSRSIIKTKFKPNSFTVANSKSFMNEVDIPRVIPLIFSLENSDVYGKSSARWQITDKNNKVIHTSNGLMSAYQFDKIGLYSVRLEIEDINGNKYNMFKSNIINVLKDYEYLKNYKNVKR